MPRLVDRLSSDRRYPDSSIIRFARSRLLGLSQQDLADQLELDRTAVSRIESGQRGIDSLELSRLSRVLQRPIDWFLTASPAAIVSRRSEVIERRDLPVDALLESLARDVELLVELGFLVPTLQRVEGPVGDVQQAEAAAAEARRKLGCDGPAWDLVRLGEKAGLYAFSLGLERQGVEGCYMGRRLPGRPTLAMQRSTSVWSSASDWSATCSQLRNLQLISPAEREELIGQPPGWIDYVERELAVREELAATGPAGVRRSRRQGLRQEPAGGIAGHGADGGRPGRRRFPSHRERSLSTPCGAKSTGRK